MLRKTNLSLAPPKAHFLFRIMGPEFGGIKWNKVRWGSPYLNMYPWSHFTGSQHRLLSNFCFLGDPHNRMSLMSLRRWVVSIPFYVLLVELIFQISWYQWYKIREAVLQIPIPDDIKKVYEQEMKLAARNKPGVFPQAPLGWTSIHAWLR